METRELITNNLEPYSRGHDIAAPGPSTVQNINCRVLFYQSYTSPTESHWGTKSDTPLIFQFFLSKRFIALMVRCFQWLIFTNRSLNRMDWNKALWEHPLKMWFIYFIHFTLPCRNKERLHHMLTTNNAWSSERRQGYLAQSQCLGWVLNHGSLPLKTDKD